MFEIQSLIDLRLFNQKLKSFSENELESEIEASLSPFIEGKSIIFGPPYASGSLHLGNGTGVVIKDSFLRYNNLYDPEKNKKFYYALDCQGLPLELKIEKQYLEKGIKKTQVDPKIWVEKCLSLAEKNSEKIIEQVNRLNPVIKVKKEEIIKTTNLDYKIYMMDCVRQLHRQGKLKEGKKHFHYCPNCECSLSNAEIEFKEKEKKIYVIPLKIKNKEKTYLLVATTMPYSLFNNYACFLRPKTYYKVLVDNEDNKFIYHGAVEYSKLVNDSKNFFLKSTNLRESEETYYSEDLVGAEYEPFSVYTSTNPNLIYVSDLVKVKKEEDEEESLKFDWLSTIGGVQVSPWDSQADYAHLIVKDKDLNYKVGFKDKEYFERTKKLYTDKQFQAEMINLVKEKSIFIVKYLSEQPRCWRCKNVLFEWFLSQLFLQESDYQRQSLLEYVSKMNINQEALKNKLYNYLQKNKPWCISRSRIYGTPFPFGICENKNCSIYKELQEISFKKEDFENEKECFHPFIKDVFKRKGVSCSCCSHKLNNLPFCMDVWLDSGFLPYYLKDVFDFVAEGQDQIAGWYLSTLVLGNMLGRIRPYKGILFTPWLLSSVTKRKFSKSENSGESFQKQIEEVGLKNYRSFCNSKVTGKDILFKKELIFYEKKYVNNILNLKKFLEKEIILDKVIDLKGLWSNRPTDTNLEIKRFFLEYLTVRNNLHKLFQEGKITEFWNILKNYLLLTYSRAFINTNKKDIKEYSNYFLRSLTHATAKELLDLSSIILGDF